MMWYPHLPSNHPMEITVTFLLDYATVTTAFEGENNWDEQWCLLWANRMLQAEYSFSPYDFLLDHEIEVEPIGTVYDSAGRDVREAA